jgi:FtsH-binding integral membrane protein
VLLSGLAVIAVSHGGSFGHSLLARLDQGVHDRAVWIALALTAVIVVVMSVAVWFAQEWAFHRGGKRG